MHSDGDHHIYHDCYRQTNINQTDTQPINHIDDVNGERKIQRGMSDDDGCGCRAIETG